MPAKADTSDRGIHRIYRGVNAIVDVVEISFRHRAGPDESVENLHAGFAEALSEFPPPWGYYPNQAPAVHVNNAELMSVVTLDELSARGMRCYISYPLRNADYLEDNARFDDFAVIELRAKNLDLSEFVERIFPRYVEAFDCYRATVANRAVAQEDWGAVVEQCNASGRDVNGRDGVFRINEANFFDRELCRRAFRLTPEKVAARLQGKIERVSLFRDGVILVCGTGLLPRDELDSIGAEVLSTLQ